MKHIKEPPYTPSERREIYFTAYCCLDGEECELTDKGFARLIETAMGIPIIFLPELACKIGIWLWIIDGSPGWPQRREILVKAIEGTYKK